MDADGTVTDGVPFPPRCSKSCLTQLVEAYVVEPLVMDLHVFVQSALEDGMRFVCQVKP